MNDEFSKEELRMVTALVSLHALLIAQGKNVSDPTSLIKNAFWMADKFIKEAEEEQKVNDN